ncbi:uncharacterized protein LOC131157921 isoform X2 [Malania oleifera]|uniref:uncharacterized protein LOC131157921 isoform X2 n=1 Tax=Malania oleifera TaxID=397392 RepID=UPI0025ADD4EB|nr:uncharacterized protein LOC131157921 isoform X2 [Malania oleifera]
MCSWAPPYRLCRSASPRRKAEGAMATVVANPSPRLLISSGRRSCHTVMSSSSYSSSSPSLRSLRYAVLGAGFSGLSVAWHLLQHSPKELHLGIDIFDEVGIGGGASGVSGGLLHPYSPKVKLLWGGAECWKECLKLLRIAETAVSSSESGCGTEDSVHNPKSFMVRRRGILRPATNLKNLTVLNDQCLASCRIETIDNHVAQNLVPNICIPFNSAFYMPEAITIYPQSYLQGLFSACENLAKEMSTSNFGKKELCLHKKSIERLNELADEYDAVIICLGARADMLPELSGRLPFRTCRGVITHLQLPDDIGESYPDHSPSILSDAWLAFQERRSVYVGSTWEWRSRNYSPNVSPQEASNALQELLPKASAIYPSLSSWIFTGARAGLRAMPPLTPHGSLPLLGCVDDFVGQNRSCKYWFFGGLGARGLLYHGWLGKLIAQAVISCNEEVIPQELTSWKKSSNKQESHSMLG